MRGCGTQWNDDYSEGEDTYVEYDPEQTLEALELLAKRHEFLAKGLRAAVESCRQKHSIEGLSIMVALAFNSQQYTPSYGGGGQLPASDEPYNVIIIKTEGVATKDGTGQMLALTLGVVDGPEKGNSQIDRLNLYNPNPETVRIANQQLSAYCYVTGKFQLQDTDELKNIPFKVRIRKQKNDERYTEIAEIYYANGSPVGKGGAAPQQNNQGFGGSAQQPQGQPPAGVQAQGSWGQGGPQSGPQSGFGGGPQNGPPPPNQGGFGQPQQQNEQPQSGWGQPQSGGGAPGWGKPGG